MNKSNLNSFIFTGLCIAIGFLLVQFCKVIPIANANAILLPMHISVLICGLVCGARYGMVAGISLPLITFLLTGKPVIYPIGLAMMFELTTYGIIIALMYKATNGKLIISLVTSLIAGRIVYGIAATILFSFTNIPFGFSMFISTTVAMALPGIIIQLLLIPLLWKALKNAKISTVTSY